jgi:hypothetical protein
VLFAVVMSPVAIAEDRRPTIGWLEHVSVDEAGMSFRAKIDTGADSSSINAEVIKPFIRKGQTWIRFRLSNWQGQKQIVERKVERYTKIKRKMALSIKRPVVRLTLCMAGVRQTSEVSLADRSNFKYQLLIGRNFLSSHFVIDPGREYLTTPICADEENGTRGVAR